MPELKTFKLEEKFSGIEDLYNYLQKNVATIEKLTGIRIQKPLKERPYCITAKEKRIASRGCTEWREPRRERCLTRATKQITERQILFFASKSEFPESLGELILLAGAFNADVLFFFVPKITPAKLEPITWLHKNFDDDTQIILGEAGF